MWARAQHGAAQPISLYVKRQPRLLDGSQRDAALLTRLWLQHRDLRSRLPLQCHDLRFDPASVIRAQDVRPRPHEPMPFRGGSQRPLSRRRHLQHVLRRHQFTPVQSGLERTGRPRAVIDSDRRAIPPIDPSLDQRAASRSPAPQLHKIESDLIKLQQDNIFQRVLHISSRQSSRTKKCGERPPHSAPDHECRVAMIR
jgi:hypothetical protein